MDTEQAAAPAAQETEPIVSLYQTALDWLTANGLELAKNALAAVVILIIAAVVIKTVRGVMAAALSKSGKLSQLLQNFIVNLASKILWILAWVLVIAQFGIEVGPLIAGLGVAGFIFGFAFQDSLSNFAAGLMILANDPFQAGDYVEIAGNGGVVKEVNMMATTLTTPDNRRLTLPNKLVWGAPIVNYSATGQRRVDMTVGVSYGADLGKTREVIMGLLKADSRVLQDPAPVVEVSTLADSAVTFVVRPWTKTADYWDVLFAFQQNVKEALDAAGIEIPFPQRVVHMVKD